MTSTPSYAEQELTIEEQAREIQELKDRIAFLEATFEEQEYIATLPEEDVVSTDYAWGLSDSEGWINADESIADDTSSLSTPAPSEDTIHRNSIDQEVEEDTADSPDLEEAGTTATMHQGEYDLKIIEQGSFGFDENLGETLKEKTRVYDRGFYELPEGQVYLRYDYQLRTMKKAHAIVQDAIFDATRIHWPEAWKNYYIDGPRSVRLGRSELTDSILKDYDLGMFHGGMCRGPLGDASSAMMSLPDLRNKICHPRGALETSEVDTLLRYAQNVACSLCDEPRALRIRRLRDEMQQQARKEYNKIVQNEPLHCLPGQRPWAIQHQYLFQRINGPWLGKSVAEMGEIFGDAVVRAALAWKAQGQALGLSDTIILGRIELQKDKYQAAVRELEKQGIHPPPPIEFDPDFKW